MFLVDNSAGWDQDHTGSDNTVADMTDGGGIDIIMLRDALNNCRVMK